MSLACVYHSPSSSSTGHPVGGALIFSHLGGKNLSLFKCIVFPSLHVYTVYVAKWLNCWAISHSNTALPVAVKCQSFLLTITHLVLLAQTKENWRCPSFFEMIRSTLFLRKSGLFIQYKQPPTVRWFKDVMKRGNKDCREEQVSKLGPKRRDYSRWSWKFSNAIQKMLAYEFLSHILVLPRTWKQTLMYNSLKRSPLKFLTQSDKIKEAAATKVSCCFPSHLLLNAAWKHGQVFSQSVADHRIIPVFSCVASRWLSQTQKVAPEHTAASFAQWRNGQYVPAPVREEMGGLKVCS